VAVVELESLATTNRHRLTGARDDA
jgi:hypothetical protein